VPQNVSYSSIVGVGEVLVAVQIEAETDYSVPRGKEGLVRAVMGPWQLMLLVG
jgi:hypothetical protein